MPAYERLGSDTASVYRFILSKNLNRSAYQPVSICRIKITEAARNARNRQSLIKCFRQIENVIYDHTFAPEDWNLRIGPTLCVRWDGKMAPPAGHLRDVPVSDRRVLMRRIGPWLKHQAG